MNSVETDPNHSIHVFSPFSVFLKIMQLIKRPFCLWPQEPQTQLTAKDYIACISAPCVFPEHKTSPVGVRVSCAGVLWSLWFSCSLDLFLVVSDPLWNGAANKYKMAHGQPSLLWALDSAATSRLGCV